MKITPITQGGAPGSDLSGVSIGRTVTAENREKAIKIAQGIEVNPSDTPTEFNSQPKPVSLKTIRMKTNATVHRNGPGVVEQVQPEITNSTPSDITPVIEETKPLSPQLAELAKQRRALQVRERELADREKAFSSQPIPQGPEELISRLKSQPLSVLQEHGITYDQLTEAILSNQSGTNPEILALKAELKALKEGVDKTFSDKDAQAEQQVLAEIQRDINQRASSSDDFEMIRVTGKQAEVKDLIHRTFKETGEVLDTEEAMKLVEEDLINETLKIANTNKLKSRLQSTLPTQQQPPKQFKTLTNRDTARPVMDRKARAIAAALGQLKG